MLCFFCFFFVSNSQPFFRPNDDRGPEKSGNNDQSETRIFPTRSWKAQWLLALLFLFHLVRFLGVAKLRRFLAFSLAKIAPRCPSIDINCPSPYYLLAKAAQSRSEIARCRGAIGSIRLLCSCKPQRLPTPTLPKTGKKAGDSGGNRHMHNASDAMMETNKKEGKKPGTKKKTDECHRLKKDWAPPLPSQDSTGLSPVGHPSSP
ncbi:hypothetical protein QBC38DRAFT_492035 [Podospora fimiseda]|uniref:Uncharacterized protein n=1 Tax=Podospora fimiseda TaxID=252190 RepID=A0AAN7BGI3_9PEZI|nr:hypothetical protein QBC38DRAFT_492035 [Podospora fimiseda]